MALMTRKRKFLALAGVMVVLGLYAYAYRDWFRPGEIQIYDRISTGRSIRRSTRTNLTANVAGLAFVFDRYYELTDVKVVAVAELATNKHAYALWRLVSDSNSIPVKAFNYGEHIRGMRPEVKRARAEPLESNVPYRLLVQAKGHKGQHDFKIDGVKDSGQ